MNGATFISQKKFKKNHCLKFPMGGGTTEAWTMSEVLDIFFRPASLMYHNIISHRNESVECNLIMKI